MACDAFYALHEVFAFAAASELQLLNLVDVKLEKYTKDGIAETDSLPNLKYTERILYRHIQQLEQVLQGMHNARHRKWPKATSELGEKANTAKESLEKDFEHLLCRAQKLHSHCTQAIATLMSSITIAESKEAILQAQRVSKLTLLASIFVPLSFTTSFFGMNVRELGQGPQSMRLWGYLSASLFCLTMLFLIFDLTLLFKRLRSWYFRLFCCV